MSAGHCATCGHHHSDRCQAIKHDKITDGASKCGCTRRDPQ